MTQMEDLNNFTKNFLTGKQDLHFSKINILMKNSLEFQLRSILEIFDQEEANKISRDKRHIKQYRDAAINLGFIVVRFKKTQFE
ncbi:MAG: hypothetical protein OXB84_04010 [Halobacteriovoraceae bacterium]|nr:hypothetical protein [Halobacteriovoraceae bacterium]